MSTARIISNFANAFFLASGCWGDLLLIRVFLTCANIFLMAFHIVVDNDVENYVWGIVLLYLHGSSAVRLFADEGPVKLDETQEKEALWRFFYRRSGISRLLFKRYVAPFFELIEAKIGDNLDTGKYFYIIFDGSVVIKSTVAGSTRDITLVSGESFDIKHLGPLFRGKSAYTKQTQRLTPFTDQEIASTVSDDGTKLFRCSKEHMNDLCSRPESKDAFLGLLVATLSDMAERQYMKNPPIPNGSVTKDMLDEENQLLESATSTFKSTRSTLFAPLEKFEEPPAYLAGSGSFDGIGGHVLHTLRVMFLLPWPFMKWLPGLRQINSLPVPKAVPDEKRITASS